MINGLWTGKKEPFVNVAVIRNTNFSKDCKLKLDDVAYIDVEAKQFATRKLEYGDIIVEKSGGSEKQPVGRAVLFDIIEGDYSFSNFTATIRINDKGAMLPKFLNDCLYWHYQNGDTVKMQSKTTGLHNLDMKAFLRQPIPYPPLSEQERIVSELDLLTEVIDKQKAQLKELDTLAQSIFYDMFGDPVLNDKGWEKKKLGEVGTIQRGKGIQKNDFVANGKPCIHYGQIHTSFGISTNKHITEISESLFNQSIIAKKGDLLFALTSEDVEGSCKATAWMGNYDVALSSDAALYRHCLNPIFVSYFFLSEGFYIQKQKYARGFKVTHIKTSDIINFEIPLPPLSLQQSFADKVSAIEQQKAAIGRSIAETQQLFDYTMDKYFG